MNERRSSPPLLRRLLTSPLQLRRQLLIVPGLALAIALCPVSVSAQEPEEPSPPAQQVPVPEEPDKAESEDPATSLADPAIRKQPHDPCAVTPAGDEPRLDKWRREIFERVCGSAARFDALFGSRRFDEEALRTHGRAGVRVLWDEHDGVDLDGTLKVKVNFPNLDHRVGAFLGREEQDDYLRGTEADLDFLPAFFGREGTEEWLLGLGYRPVSSARSSLDFDAGVDVDSTLDPFVRSRYRRFWLVGDGHLLRARQTVYWTDQKGVGSGTRIDFERAFGSRTLARWSGNLVIDDETEGEGWNTGVTVYHGFSPDKAVSWFVGIEGETEKEVPIEVYGTRFTYRQRMLRDWLFGEVVSGVTWPRDNLQEQRELAFHVGVGFEIQFSGEDLGIGRSRQSQ